MEFNLNAISKYRPEIMGLSTIAILLCHAPARGVVMPSVLARLFELGGLGVDVFLFLSGIGIWYSLEKANLPQEGVMNWYSRRYVRMLLPYFMIVTPYYFLHMILCNESICDFLLNVSTISFWTKHEGQWFLDALLPIYLLSPFLYYGLTKDKYRHILLCLLIILCILVLNIPNYSSQPNQTILGNIQYVVKRVPGFIVGMWMAKYIKETISIQHPIAKLTAALICVVLVEKIVPLDIPIAWACVIPFIFLVATVCQYVGDSVRSMLRFMGGISLA